MTDIIDTTGAASLDVRPVRSRFAAMTIRLLGGIAASSMMLHAAAAQAQDVSDDAAAADEAPSDQEIIVTGTQLRGIAPVGTNVVTMSREDIVASPGKSANEILTRIPQVSSAFLQTPTKGLNAGLAVIRPNIRNLGAGGGTTTLVLVDGHRVVGAGVLQTTPDPDVIPPGVLQRVDVVPDGGSSIYGSDAVGGVINYISRKSFDGFEVNARTGFADDYRTTDVNVTAGKDWGSGSAYVSYAWAYNNALYGRDRDFMQQTTPNGGFCNAGTIFANGTSYEITGSDPDNLTPGTISSCDVTDPQSFWPKTVRHNIFASISQDIGSAVTVDVKGYWARRELLTNEGLGTASLNVTAANPFFDPIAGEASQSVATNFSSLLDLNHYNSLTSYGITPTLTAQVGGDWQLRAMANLGWSDTREDATTFDATAAETVVNPYDLAATPQSSLASFVRHNLAQAKQDLTNFRLIADGPLAKLPGGDVRIAIGAEYSRESTRIQSGLSAYGAENTIPINKARRNVKSAFAELAVPIFGADNARGGLQSLTLSASARYDDYSDFGDTFNPKLGLTYVPVDGLKLRANWGKSFNAPSLVDKSGRDVAGGFFSSVFAFGQSAPWAIVRAGNSGDDMRPQKATTWSLGVDVQPSAAPGLTMSATYYNIHIKDVIAAVAGRFGPELEPFWRDNVPCAEAAAELGGLELFPQTIPVALTCAFSPTTAIIDLRLQNTGEIKTDGIDFNLGYDRQVGFGTVYGRIAGTYTLNRDQSIVPGAMFIETLDSPGATRFLATATLGAQIGNLNANAALNHRSGYDLDPVIAANPANPFPLAQNDVGSFTTVDLYFDYKLPPILGTNETHLSVNITNLFNEDPPFYNSGTGFTNGSTLGRLVQFGLRTKF